MLKCKSRRGQCDAITDKEERALCKMEWPVKGNEVLRIKSQKLKSSFLTSNNHPSVRSINAKEKDPLSFCANFSLVFLQNVKVKVQFLVTNVAKDHISHPKDNLTISKRWYNLRISRNLVI